ncbi:MAG: tetratricopeptide repeat protein [Planctomycetaceae bacterium]|jgi:tetratricopeptide (TPR) repeat protein|nr:tetratricopeptide repeat protein [Planctomycetaceae bacterium]
MKKNASLFEKYRICAGSYNFEESEKILASCPQEYITPEICLNRAILLLLIDNEYSFEYIEQLYLKAIELNPNYADAHYELGKFYDVVMDDSQKSIKYLTIARQILLQQLGAVEEGIQDCIDYNPDKDFPFPSNFDAIQKRIFEKTDFCCDSMYSHLLGGDVAISYIKKYREYGIKVLDGGTSVQVLHYCPWCGSKLPESLRDEWFNTLRDMGYENPLDDDVPISYCSDLWWKDKQQYDK